ncbi:GerMN domain-containing protein [Paenibacillus sp. y28]|uniref:GerMN domain-containing protein n=1 Tax=Paenibacillus sp. y28 TaxID=3129110 RepID=UPI00301A02CD
MRHLTRSLLIMGLCIAALTGCNSARTEVNPAQQAVPTPAPAADKELQIKTFYTNSELEKLVEQQTTIRFRQDEDKYAAALTALRTPPSGELLSLVSKLQFKEVKLNEGKLRINLTIPNEARLGSGGELLMLQAISKTVFQFQEVASMELLVDGKQVESLMGHVALPYPIVRNTEFME